MQRIFIQVRSPEIKCLDFKGSSQTDCEVHDKEIREKRLSPLRAPRRSLLPLSPKRTKVRLKALPILSGWTPDTLRTHGGPSVQECRLWLKQPTPNAFTSVPSI